MNGPLYILFVSKINIIVFWLYVMGIVEWRKTFRNIDFLKNLILLRKKFELEMSLYLNILELTVFLLYSTASLSEDFFEYDDDVTGKT